MRRSPKTRPLEHIAHELDALEIPGARLTRVRGVELRYCFEISPSPFSPLYKCLLIVRRTGWPSMFVLSPDLVVSSNGKRPPHIYGYKEARTELCLWWPKQREWNRDMKFIETYIPWTAEWLWYYEYWRSSGKWVGGGVHPSRSKK